MRTLSVRRHGRSRQDCVREVMYDADSARGCNEEDAGRQNRRRPVEMNKNISASNGRLVSKLIFQSHKMLASSQPEIFVKGIWCFSGFNSIQETQA